MITVWGRATSGNVQFVMWTIAELGLDARRIDAGHRFGGLDTAAYGAMNPNRLVPVLQDGDGPFLWESGAIVRYLAAAYGDETFWPREPARRAPLDMWAEWIKTTFIPAFQVGIFGQLVFTPPARRDPAAFATSVEKVKALTGLLDDRLAGTAHLGGDEPCFADILVGGPLYRYFTLDFERADRPNLAAYYERLTRRPAYAEHVMISYDSLRAA
jgi:glutathione S-transferase